MLLNSFFNIERNQSIKLGGGRLVSKKSINNKKLIQIVFNIYKQKLEIQKLEECDA